MEDVNLMLEPLRTFVRQLGTFLPQLLLAVVILVAGWIVARLLRFSVVRALRAINFNVLTERAGVDAFLRQGAIQTDTIGIIGILTYWLVILAALMVSFNSLGLTTVTDLIGRLLLFVPHVFVAILIVAVGAYFARFVATSVTAYCRNIGIQDAEWLGRLAQWAIMLFVVVIALDQVSIGGDIIRLSFLIILSGVVLALALAFGIGGQKQAASLLERLLPRDTGGRAGKR